MGRRNIVMQLLLSILWLPLDYFPTDPILRGEKESNTSNSSSRSGGYISLQKALRKRNTDASMFY